MIVSKLDAGRSQLETAIKLYLEDRDPSSVHTLARAAHEILEVLANREGYKSLFQGAFENFIRQDKIEELKKLINEPKNFLKHASSDSGKTLEFNPDVNVFFVLDAISLYQKLTQDKSITPTMMCFNFWFSSRFPHLLLKQEDQEKFKSVKDKFGLDPTNKASFLKLLPTFESIHIDANN